MGYPMALNLRRKLPKPTKIIISELNQDIVQSFVSETADFGLVEVASTARQVSAKAVGT